MTRYTDDFNRANGAPGANWTALEGTWAISSNELRQTENISPSGGLRWAGGSLVDPTRYWVGVRTRTGNAERLNGLWIKIPTTGSDVNALDGLTVNAYPVGNSSYGGGCWAISDSTNGDWDSDLVVTSTNPPVTGTNYRIDVAVNVNDIFVYIDDVLRMTYTDAAFTSNYGVGLFAYLGAAATSTQYFDNFYYQDMYAHNAALSGVVRRRAFAAHLAR